MMKSHVIRTGEHLSRIAHDAGLDPEVVWKHPKNQELRERRGDPHILCEGDVIFLPLDEEAPLPLDVGQDNRFAAVVARTEARVRFGAADEPFANEPFVVEGLDEELRGETDGDGNLVIEAPVTARVAKVVFERLGLSFQVILGEMDPIDEVSGVELRLAMLGFLKEPPQDALEGATLEALTAFQREKRLPATGAMDPATLDALRAAYGC